MRTSLCEARYSAWWKARWAVSASSPPLAGDGEEFADGGPHGGDVVVGASLGGAFGGGRVQGQADLEKLAGFVRVHDGDPDVAVCASSRVTSQAVRRSTGNSILALALASQAGISKLVDRRGVGLMNEIAAVDQQNGSVDEAALSDAKNSAARAMSSGSPSRYDIAWAGVTLFLVPGTALLTASVWTSLTAVPGLT